jgi:hypothetical protein
MQNSQFKSSQLSSPNTAFHKYGNVMTPSKNGFAAAQKSFPLRGQADVIMIHGKPLTSSLERRKTFDSPLANHFSAVMQSSGNMILKKSLTR